MIKNIGLPLLAVFMLNAHVNSATIIISEETAKIDELNKKLITASNINGNVIEIEKLIQLGANIDTCDERGKTPLMLASSLGDIPMVKLLLSRNANVDLVDQFNRTALVYTKSELNMRTINLDNGESRYIAIVKLLTDESVRRLKINMFRTQAGLRLKEASSLPEPLINIISFYLPIDLSDVEKSKIMIADPKSKMCLIL